MIDVDERTIMKIEKGDSNPTLECIFLDSSVKD